MKTTPIALLLSLILCLPLSLVHAQNVDIKWSAPQACSFTSSDPLLLGEDGTFFYVLRGSINSSLGGYIIEVINKKTLAVERELLLGKKELPEVYAHTIEEIFFDNQQFFIFTKGYDKKIIRLYGTIVDKSGKVITQGKFLDEIDNTGKKFRGNFEVLTNKKSSGFLVYANVPVEKKEYEKISYKMFDSDLKPRFTKQLNLPYLDKDFTIYTTLLDSKGNVYLIGSKKEENEEDKTTIVFYYSTTQQGFGEIKIPLTNKWNTGIHFDLDDDDHLVVTGLYTNNLKKTDYREGIFYVRMDLENNKVLENRNTKFDLNSMKSLGKKFAKENLLSRSFHVKNIYKEDDDSFLYLLEAEESHIHQEKITTFLVSYQAHMLVTKVDKKGEILWTVLVPKEQRINTPINRDIYDMRQNTSLLSFMPMYKDGTLYLIYNDHKDNLAITTPDDTKVTNMRSSAACFLATITKKGELSRNILFHSKEEGNWITPKNSKQINTKQAILFSYEAKEEMSKMGVLNLQE